MKAAFSLNVGVRFVNFYSHQLRVVFQVICIVRAMSVSLPSLCFIRDGKDFKQLISFCFFVIQRNFSGYFS